MKRTTIIASALALCAGCSDPMTGTWTIARWHVDVDSVACDGTTSSTSHVADEVGTLTLHDDGTAISALRTRYDPLQSSDSDPFVDIDTETTSGPWRRIDDAIRLEVQPLWGNWRAEDTADDVLTIASPSSATIFEPCGSNAVTYRLELLP